MSTEQVKTAAWLAIAAALSILAFLNLPKAIELESQAKVNQALFPAYQASSIWEIHIQQPPTAEYKLRRPTAVVEQLTAKRSAGRGWELLEYAGFPAENTQRIGQLSAILNDLKILEVVSENASATELAEYGLLETGGAEGLPSQRATRLKLSTSEQTVVGDLLVGKSIPAKDQAVATAYVRPYSDSAIYRVALDKDLLRTSLLEWINPNPLSIQGPPDLPRLGPAFRVVTRIEVGTPQTGRPNSDPYRADFKYSEPVSLENLFTVDGGQWQSIPKSRLPASLEFTQGWRRGMDVVPALLFLLDVKRKSPAAVELFLQGTPAPEKGLAELPELGFAFETAESGSRLVGETGQMTVVTEGGVQFHFAAGRVTAENSVPVVIYANLRPDVDLPPPTLGELPPESVDWPEEKRASELDNLRRELARQTEDWERFQQQRQQDLTMTNERLAQWIFYLPAEYVTRAIPDLRLGPVQAAEVENGKAQEDAADQSDTANQSDSANQSDAADQSDTADKSSPT